MNDTENKKKQAEGGEPEEKELEDAELEKVSGGFTPIMWPVWFFAMRSGETQRFPLRVFIIKERKSSAVTARKAQKLQSHGIIIAVNAGFHTILQKMSVHSTIFCWQTCRILVY